MFDSNDILQLYANVLHEDIIVSKIREKDIRMGVRDMAQSYAPESTNFEGNITNRKFTNFNVPAFRCAYLHKYAPLHTYIVLDIMKKILNQEILMFKNILKSKELRLCCLGGGPGSDAIGVLAALYSQFTFKTSLTIVDFMENWKYTFNLVINHLQYGNFGTQWNYLQWDYLGADLLKFQSITDTVKNAISSASLITMVKFVSAATCNSTELMVETIFHLMRPGALVLYIDNAANCFTRIIEGVSKKLKFKIIAGPYRHMEYSNEDLKVERFGYTSCFNTKVTVILLRKPGQFQNVIENPSQANYSITSTPAVNRQASIYSITSTPAVNKQATYSSQSISSKRQAPLLGEVIRSQAITAQEKFNNSQPRNPGIRPPTSSSVSNGKGVRPSSNTRAVKVNNSNRQYERFYPQSTSSSTASVSAVNAQPTRRDQVTYSVTADDSQDSCCACCVIS